MKEGDDNSNMDKVEYKFCSGFQDNYKDTKPNNEFMEQINFDIFATEPNIAATNLLRAMY